MKMTSLTEEAHTSTLEVWLDPVLTMEEHRVVHVGNGRCVPLLLAALPFLQLHGEVLLRHAVGALWVNTRYDNTC